MKQEGTESGSVRITFQTYYVPLVVIVLSKSNWKHMLRKEQKSRRHGGQCGTSRERANSVTNPIRQRAHRRPQSACPHVKLPRSHCDRSVYIHMQTRVQIPTYIWCVCMTHMYVHMQVCGIGY